MKDNKGTVITLPKGTKVFEAGGAFELGGTVARLAEDARVEFDRVLDDKDLASFFVAGNRPELLQVLKGKFTAQGIPLEERLNAPIDKDLEGIDAIEMARLERQSIEDDRLDEVRKIHDKHQKKAVDAENRRLKSLADEALRVAELTAEEKAAEIDRDLRAKAAAADYETIKDDTRRATDRQIYAETNGTAARGTEASIGTVTPDDLLNIPDEKKIAPDYDTILREVKAVEKIGIENAAVAKADKTAHNFNEVINKDGTNFPSVTEKTNKEKSVERVDQKTDLKFLRSDDTEFSDKEAKKAEKEVEKGKKQTEKESKDTGKAEKVLKEEKETYDKAKLETGKLDEKKAAKAKSDEEVTETKLKAAEKAEKQAAAKLPVKK